MYFPLVVHQVDVDVLSYMASTLRSQNTCSDPVRLSALVVSSSEVKTRQTRWKTTDSGPPGAQMVGWVAPTAQAAELVSVQALDILGEKFKYSYAQVFAL